MGNSTMPSMLAAACVLGLLAGVYAPDAGAASQRARYTRPSGICEAPLPMYDVHLRKSPMAVSNTGSQVVFVNCAMPTDPVGDLGRGWVQIDVKSEATETASVTCTLVTGTADAPVYDARTRSLSPGSNTWFGWTSANKVTPDGLFAFMCALPPGLQLTSIYLKEDDSDGGI